MTFNTDLAERVLAQIKDHPETWDQSVWANDCGTAFCFAGWATQLSGLEVAQENNTGLFCRLTNGQTVAEAACELLGIGYGTLRRTALFKADNDMDAIEQLVKHYANNPDDNSLPEDVA